MRTAAIVRVQATATVTAGGKPLEKRCALSHRAPCLMWLRSDVAPQTGLIGLKGRPIDEALMVFWDEYRPLRLGQAAQSSLERAVLVDIAFLPGLSIGIRASIDRIAQYVIDRRVGGGHPTDLVGARVVGLQGKGQALGAKPQPHPAR